MCRVNVLSNAGWNINLGTTNMGNGQFRVRKQTLEKLLLLFLNVAVNSIIGFDMWNWFNYDHF